MNPSCFNQENLKLFFYLITITKSNTLKLLTLTIYEKLRLLLLSKLEDSL